jgi:hypothetical protein
MAFDGRLVEEHRVDGSSTSIGAEDS